MSKHINNWVPEVRSFLISLILNKCVIVSGDNGDDRDSDMLAPAQDGTDKALTSESWTKFIEHCIACDEFSLYVRTPELAHQPGRLRWISCVLGNEPGTLPSDYTVDAFIEKATSEHYDKWDGKEQPKKPCPHYAAKLKRYTDIAAKLNAFLGCFSYGTWLFRGDGLGALQYTPSADNSWEAPAIFSVVEGQSCGQDSPLLQCHGTGGAILHFDMSPYLFRKADGATLFPRS